MRGLGPVTEHKGHALRNSQVDKTIFEIVS